MKILVTGAFGYLGYSVVDNLLQIDRDVKIVLYDNLQRKNLNFFHFKDFHNKERIEDVYYSDILNYRSLMKALKDVDVVIHLAAIVSTPFADYQANVFDQINNWGSCSLSDAIEEIRTIKHVIYTSSTSVYGDTHSQIFNEESNVNPTSFYGISKLKGEKQILRLSENTKKTIFRIGSIFGYNPCIRFDSVLNKFTFDAHFKNKIIVQGNGNQYRGFTNISTLSKEICHRVFMDDNSPQVQNIVEYNYTINELSNLILKIWPKTEVLHSMQHINMRSIYVESIYDESNDLNDKDIIEKLEQIKDSFSF